MISYCATLDVPRQSATALARLLSRHRRALGTRRLTRALTPWAQAVLILRWCRDATRIKNLARDAAIWLNYRRAEPAGRRSSLLDDINTTTWPLEWTRELTDLLTVLTRLVDLEPAQADLLTDVLAGSLLSTTALTDAGVAWPTSRTERRPHHPSATHDSGALFT